MLSFDVVSDSGYTNNMLIIGHRGAKGVAPENTMESLQAGYDAQADMLEFDVRTTKDNVLIVIHDARLLRTHRRPVAINTLTLEQLRELTVHDPVPTLTEVLDEFYGRILLNIEVKSRGAGEAVVKLLKKHYVTKASDWDNVLVSCFRSSELLRMRKLSSRVNLALLHDDNPFIFIAYQRRLRLTAVGFHRLYLNRFALEIAKRSGLFIYVYTVNRIGAIQVLEQQGVDGVVTNYPESFRHYLQARSDLGG